MPDRERNRPLKHALVSYGFNDADDHFYRYATNHYSERSAWYAAALTIRARQPGNPCNLDPVIGKGLCLLGRALAIDTAGFSLATVDAP